MNGDCRMIFNYYPAAFNTADNEFTHYEDEGVEFSLEEHLRYESAGFQLALHSAQLQLFEIGQRFCIGWYDTLNADCWVLRVE